MTFSNMVQGINGFLVSLRCNNAFDEQIYSEIKEYLILHSRDWKVNKNIPIEDAVALFDLIDQLSGGSIFWSEDVMNRVEDAVLEIQDIIHALE